MAMEDDILVPKPAANFPRNLEPLSVDALKQYLVELDRERSRTQQELERKQRATAAAEQVFRS
ncbi:MAG: DUF1192 domain-containing protein [Rhodospirillales bacterium]|jgi:uncharacterized small protein (DUF1192 family)|nr:DUF1192 domain-containing protein [Rhodospirillales bacterium]MCY3855280.1 DUF1192 domain-containing protein [Rhodospirillales bacterium]MCY4005194.1 DUF1192 domain-containing protein [Rhodospirillales bacterium]MDE0371123.1 DUF1192 domain-containing protein [Rhodospirillales bacterium]MDE0710736.1 DUF1192 domain-containing protein [Rhodospirillales bacterium]